MFVNYEDQMRFIHERIVAEWYNTAMPKLILAVENAIFLILSVYLFYIFGGSWVFFLALFLVPDVSMAGYLINISFGAFLYNLVHNYFLAICLLVVAALIKSNVLAEASFILAAHVSVDRLFGFGLKYPTHFKDTHIQKL